MSRKDTRDGLEKEADVEVQSGQNDTDLKISDGKSKGIDGPMPAAAEGRLIKEAPKDNYYTRREASRSLTSIAPPE